MRLLSSITVIIAAASAGQIYHTAPQQESYANSAEIYQSQLEYQQHGLYNDQSQAYTGHESHASAHEGQSSAEKSARILSFVSELNDHAYQYAYETENGIKAQEVGQVQKGTKAHGAYSYKGDDGQTYTITYTADEHGFRPQGAHIPTPPPIPEAIAKAMEQNAKDEAAGIFDDGKYIEQQQHDKEGYQPHQIHQVQSQQAEIHQDEGFQVQGHQVQIHQPQIYHAESHQSQIHHPQTHQAPTHQALVHEAQIQQVQTHQALTHQAQIQQAQTHQALAHQAQIQQAHQVQANQIQAQQVRAHLLQANQASAHPVQAHQVHYQQPLQMYRISQPYRYPEANTVQRETYSGQRNAEIPYHKH